MIYVIISFNRFHEFSEWGQCLLLEILLRYMPENDEEMFDIMVSIKKLKQTHFGRPINCTYISIGEANDIPWSSYFNMYVID